MSKEGMHALDTVRLYMYYIIIGVVSFIALVFIPMIGSELEVGWKLPNTAAGWVVWATTRIIVSTVNVLIFHSFILQGKVNIKDDEKYKEAANILGELKEKNYIPRSPKKFFAGEYGRKGIAIFGGTLLASVALTQAILSYDWVSMLTYLFTIIFGIIFGLLEMKRVEEFWTTEFYDYAKNMEREAKALKHIREETLKAVREHNELVAATQDKPEVTHDDNT